MAISDKRANELVQRLYDEIPDIYFDSDTDNLVDNLVKSLAPVLGHIYNRVVRFETVYIPKRLRIDLLDLLAKKFGQYVDKNDLERQRTFIDLIAHWVSIKGSVDAYRGLMRSFELKSDIQEVMDLPIVYNADTAGDLRLRRGTNIITTDTKQDWVLDSGLPGALGKDGYYITIFKYGSSNEGRYKVTSVYKDPVTGIPECKVSKVGDSSWSEFLDDFGGDEWVYAGDNYNAQEYIIDADNDAYYDDLGIEYDGSREIFSEEETPLATMSDRYYVSLLENDNLTTIMEDDDELLNIWNRVLDMNPKTAQFSGFFYKVNYIDGANTVSWGGQDGALVQSVIVLTSSGLSNGTYTFLVEEGWNFDEGDTTGEISVIGEEGYTTSVTADGITVNDISVGGSVDNLRIVLKPGTAVVGDTFTVTITGLSDNRITITKSEYDNSNAFNVGFELDGTAVSDGTDIIAGNNCDFLTNVTPEKRLAVGDKLILDGTSVQEIVRVTQVVDDETIEVHKNVDADSFTLVKESFRGGVVKFDKYNDPHVRGVIPVYDSDDENSYPNNDTWTSENINTTIEDSLYQSGLLKSISYLGDSLPVGVYKIEVSEAIYDEVAKIDVYVWDADLDNGEGGWVIVEVGYDVVADGVTVTNIPLSRYPDSAYIGGVFDTIETSEGNYIQIDVSRVDSTDEKIVKMVLFRQDAVTDPVVDTVYSIQDVDEIYKSPYVAFFIEVEVDDSSW